MLSTAMFQPLNLLISAVITLIALTGHEFAHGWVSYKLGDPTPRMQGRLTLNPLAHLDLVGTLLMILTGFGWAKPVAVNPNYYKNPKAGMALTAAAGPLANLVMAILALLLYALFFIIAVKAGFNSNEVIASVWGIVQLFVIRNLAFMVFNFIPIPPLDGAKVLGIFIPDNIYYTILRYERYSMILIMLLSLSGAFSYIIGNGVQIAANAIWTPIFNLIQAVL